MDPADSPTVLEMTDQGRCGRCRYSLLDLVRVTDSVVCPECGTWNTRPAFLNFFPWPSRLGIAARLCWPAAAVLLVLPAAVLVLPEQAIGVLALLLAGACGIVPPVVAMRLVRIRVAPERQGRAMGLLSGLGAAVNMGVLLVVLLVIVINA